MATVLSVLALPAMALGDTEKRIRNHEMRNLFEKCRDFSLTSGVYLLSARKSGASIPKVRVPATQNTSERASARSWDFKFPPLEIPTVEAAQGASTVLFVPDEPKASFASSLTEISRLGAQNSRVVTAEVEA